MSHIRRILCCFALVFLAGCESYQGTVRGLGHSVGGIDIKDIQQADSLRNGLPAYLGLLAGKIQVESGSGVIHVTIFGVNVQSDRQVIDDKIQKLQAENPKLEPIKLKFEK